MVLPSKTYGAPPERHLESEPLVDRSTTATKWVDEEETGWTGQYDRGAGLTTETKVTTLPR